MPGERRKSQLELVESLASSIQKRLVEPAEDRAKHANNEIKELSGRLSGIEQKVALLTESHRRTRLLVYVCLAVAALLVLCRAFHF